MNDLTATVRVPSTATVSRADEYVSIPVSRRREQLFRDAYPHFGWAVEKAVERSADTVALRLRRSWTRRPAAPLDELQQQAEQALRAVEELDRSTHAWGARATFAAHVTGGLYSVLGVIAMSAGFAPTVVVVIGVLGLAHGLLGKTVGAQVRRRRATKVDPLIAEQIDVVEAAVRQARTIGGAAVAGGDRPISSRPPVAAGSGHR